MKEIKVEQGTDEWRQERKTRITGSRLKNLVVRRGTERKDEFYKLLADYLAIDDEADETDMDRGNRLEDEAIAETAKFLGVKTTRPGIWVSDENDKIAISPDAAIGDTEAIETKCPRAYKHLRVVVEQKIPKEYFEQVCQYFIVNEKLRTLYFVSYNPLVKAQPLVVVTITRDELEGEIEFLREYQLDQLEEIRELVEELSF